MSIGGIQKNHFCFHFNLRTVFRKTDNIHEQYKLTRKKPFGIFRTLQNYSSIGRHLKASYPYCLAFSSSSSNVLQVAPPSVELLSATDATAVDTEVTEPDKERGTNTDDDVTAVDTAVVVCGAAVETASGGSDRN